jgi:TonB-dependent receptor
MRSILHSLRLAFTITLLGLTPALAQVGSIAGTVKDTSDAILPGATVKLNPGDASTISNDQGEFTIAGVAPGAYTVTVKYVGFLPYTGSVTVVAGKVARVNAVVTVASESEAIIVTAERAHGEAEAINEELVTDNVLSVLPAEVISSLPNANIADAVGRAAGVTLERDEGEGKYVQIRGTEPRLANLTIDGVEVPSPETGVRQVKLDTIPSDLVESVQINKTLEANMNGDAIGGTVNLVTRKAGNQPHVSLYGSGGVTPIANTRHVYEFGGIAGARFGADKRLGLMASGSYDYNGRGIDDVEPAPWAPLCTDPAGCPPGTTFVPDLTSVAIRQYLYDRKRYGFGASADYRLNDNSNLYVHSLYSDFKDNGDRYEYILNTNDSGIPGPITPGFTTEIRNPNFQVANLSLGGNHVVGTSLFNWQVAVGRSRQLNPIGGGESHDIFGSTLASSNCQYLPSATTNPYLPQFSPACFSEAYDPTQLSLQTIQDSAHGKAAQLNLEGTASYAKNYHVGSHPSTFETGFYFRNAHKFDDSYEIDWCPTNPTAPLASQFLNGFKNSNYYNGHYPFGPGVSWEKINTFFMANRGLFDTVSGVCAPPPLGGNGQTAPQGGNNNNFDLVERVTAGYVMDSLDFSRFRIKAGVRFEGTQDNTLSCNCGLDPNSPNGGPTTFPGHGSYISVLPSVSLRMRLDSQNNSALRFVYARGLSRPDPAFLTSAISVDNSTTPPTVIIGNPALVPEHGQNFDVLYERYLTPLGSIQAGFFYKRLTEPIVSSQSGPKPSPGCPQATCFVVQDSNSGDAHIAGFEIAFQQHLGYLPGLLSGLGISANYSYATSQANGLGGRSDHPALLRQAPNTWNISPTYDHGRLSTRVGLAYNGANIFQYAYADGTPFGIKGPLGDLYLYSHFQVDAQGSVYLGKGFKVTVSGLNLNNEVFGFYQGSSQYPIQREYYKPTYTFGLRWDLHHEK